MDKNAPARRYSEACARNRAPILAVLQRVLPAAGRLLEIGAGTGQHAAYFAPHFPGLTWQPTEPDADDRASIEAWAAETNALNLRPPIDLDVTEAAWPVEQEARSAATGTQQEARSAATGTQQEAATGAATGTQQEAATGAARTGTQQEARTGAARTGTPKFSAVFSANMIHIAAWDCCLGLMAGAGRILSENGTLILYGPFKQGGHHTAPSNAQFDDSLRRRNAAWGIRDEEAVIDAAAANGLAHIETVQMPANNRMQIFQRRG